jgi:hypothetical protein
MYMALKFLILGHKTIEKQLNSFFMYEEDPHFKTFETKVKQGCEVWFGTSVIFHNSLVGFFLKLNIGCQLGFQYHYHNLFISVPIRLSNFLYNNCQLCILKNRFSNTQLLTTS